MRIFVTGATGFIGRAVCRAAVQMGHDVTGLGRRGRPADADAELSTVQWLAGDVLRPESWRNALSGCDAIIHCVGIIRERPEQAITFERMNGDALITVVDEAEKAGVSTVVFFSASATPPGVSERYLAEKRRAETSLMARRSLRGVVLRPGFVHGRERWITEPVAAAMQLALHLPGLPAHLRASRPIPAEVVARAAVRAAEDATVRGILDADGIEALASDRRR